MPKRKSDSATPFCKMCFKDLKENSLKMAFHRENLICHRCYLGLNPIYQHFVFHKIKFLAIYEYGEGMQSALYQFKGCYDIELAPLFLDYPLPWLKLRYRNYVLVPAPSSASHNEQRGFNHVIEAFSVLGLPILPILAKKSDRKQTDCTAEQRAQVGEILTIAKKVDLRDKNVLFVDDVFTTGSTAKACLSLIASLHPKRMEGLVLSKVIPK